MSSANQPGLIPSWLDCCLGFYMSVKSSSQIVLAASIICQILRGSQLYNSWNRCWPKILKRVSLKTGHSKIKWLDVSSSSPQALQIGSGYCSGFSRRLWHLRKLWPEIHLYLFIPCLSSIRSDLFIMVTLNDGGALIFLLVKLCCWTHQLRNYF